MTVLVAVALAAASAAVLAGDPGHWRLAALQPAPSYVLPRLPWWGLGALPGLVAGPVVAVLGVVAALLLRSSLAARRQARADAEERRRALEAMAVLSADLRTGRSPAEALAAAAEAACGGTATALASAAAAARVAGDVPGALVAADCVVPEILRALAACWSVTAVSGSGLAAGVERLEEGLRAAAVQRRAVESELAGPRATAALLAVLPVAGVLLATALGADPVHVLLHTPVGLVCLLAGLGLDVLGLAWTRRLVARAVPA